MLTINRIKLLLKIYLSRINSYRHKVYRSIDDGNEELVIGLDYIGSNLKLTFTFYKEDIYSPLLSFYKDDHRFDVRCKRLLETDKYRNLETCDLKVLGIKENREIIMLLEDILGDNLPDDWLEFTDKD